MKTLVPSIRTSIRAIGLCAATSCALGQSLPPWSFRRPERPPLPEPADPGWCRQPLDRFVLARLEEEGLTTAPEAERAELLRRLALDLTGLPPTPAEVDAFLADDRPDAYERRVERLLASPHHGERMALPWLDLARYSDTNGYGDDEDRQMWLWRDWVVRAFDENMPFDEFTVAQLAGDLLPGATLEQRVATGFHRNHPVAPDMEGQPGEYEHQYVADRVNTTATAWLGLTMACAECHDHEYDPLSQRDYYRFYAFFDGEALDGLERGGNAAPLVARPSVEQGARLVELEARLARCADELERWDRATAEEFLAWRTALVAEGPGTEDGDEDELELHAPLDRDEPWAKLGGIGVGKWVPGVRGGAVELDGLDALIDCGFAGAFDADEAFSGGLWVRPDFEDPRDLEGTLIGRVDEFRDYRGWSLWLNDGRPQIELISGEGDDLTVRARDPLPNRRWSHVLFTYDGSRNLAGLALYVDGARVPMDTVEETVERLVGEIDCESRLRLGSSDDDSLAGTLDEFRLWGRALPAAEVAGLVRSDLAHVAREDRPFVGEEHLLRDHWAGRVNERLAAVREERALARIERAELLADVPVVSVLAASTGEHETRLRIRGEYDALGEVVSPGVPAALPSLIDEPPTDRLGLARWLVHPDNPLVGRVAVNRLWQQFFGRGLVATSEDFGTRGSAPSHPELLDWLAREFVDGGFDTRALVRRIVTSSTYRQSSRVTPDALERDPENVWLSRAPRVRLSAELVRDNALAIAGVLDPTVGGPSVRPPEPTGLWNDPTPLTRNRRRGLYVYHKRHQVYASFALFDAPDRQVCATRRERTTTPLQALALLNDPVHVDAARGLAGRALDAPGDDDARLVHAFRRCVARAPGAGELRVLRSLLADERTRAGASGEDAFDGQELCGSLRRDAELDAWTGVATVLLNLEETLTRG